MKRLRWKQAGRKLLQIYKRATSKKYSTIAGTLVFFLLLSIIPFFYLSLLLFKPFFVQLEDLIKLEIFNNYKNVLELILITAKSASGSFSLLFALSAIFSSTNFFYHMRKSGEIIYNYSRKKAGLLIRLSATVLVFLVMFAGIVTGLITLFISAVFEQILPQLLYRIFIYIFLAFLCFIVIVVLNLYICPYRNKIANTLRGSFFTLIFWVFASLGLSIYGRLSGGLQKLYGAMSFIMAFLFWLYFMMQGLLLGVIINMKKTQKGSDKKY